MAKYFDKLMQARIANVPREEGQGPYGISNAFLKGVISEYSKAMKGGYGENTVFEALPRVLTLWFTHGDDVIKEAEEVALNSMSNQGKSKMNEDISRLMEALVVDLDASQWWLVMGQLVSRITHQNQGVWTVIKKILVKVCRAFPSRAIWHITGLVHSKLEMRKDKGLELRKALEQGVLTRASNKKKRRVVDKAFVHRIKAGMEVCKELITLAEINVGTGRVDISEHLATKQMADLLKQSTVAIPTQAAMTSSSEAHLPWLVGFGTYCDVMVSKVHPKKISLKANDGSSLHFLLKFEIRVDLRKDARMMEFGALVNKLFLQDDQGRKRGLRLRTYAVICLDEMSGILEWVENTKGIRKVMEQVFGKRSHDLKATRKALERLQKKKLPLEVMLHQYRTSILPRHPPRFHRWFSTTFAEPGAWLEARTRFTRSAATWSMAGHVIGLGDRHTENLMVDESTGECVHVDFDCLFDKGLNLVVPEIVPFRLTPHMVDGMGIAGVDGVFRRSCEISMGVLRGNKDLLMSMLEAFVVDPLVDYNKSKASKSGNKQSDNFNFAKESMKKEINLIGQRLNGVVQSRNGKLRTDKLSRPKQKVFLLDEIPLSIEGQVERLISDAIDDRLLMRMYIGWTPYL